MGTALNHALFSLIWTHGFRGKEGENQALLEPQDMRFGFLGLPRDFKHLEGLL